MPYEDDVEFPSMIQRRVEQHWEGWVKSQDQWTFVREKWGGAEPAAVRMNPRQMAHSTVLNNWTEYFLLCAYHVSITQSPTAAL